MIICSVFDYASNTFGNCFSEQNEETAKRNFAIACSNPDSLLNTCPADFSLFSVGHFDTATGEIVTCNPTQRLVNATDFVRSE